MTNLLIHELHSSKLEDGLLDLSDEQQQAINGGKDCTYASQTYSAGSLIKMVDDLTYKCSGDSEGTWTRH